MELQNPDPELVPVKTYNFHGEYGSVEVILWPSLGDTVAFAENKGWFFQFPRLNSERYVYESKILTFAVTNEFRHPKLSPEEFIKKQLEKRELAKAEQHVKATPRRKASKA